MPIHLRNERRMAMTDILYEGIQSMCAKEDYYTLDVFFESGVEDLSIDEILTFLTATLPWSTKFRHRERFYLDAEKKYSLGLVKGLNPTGETT